MAKFLCRLTSTLYKMLRLLAIVTLFLGAQGQSAVESITSLGYPAESYNVTTSDGYILEVLRIPNGKNSSKSNGKLVFLMHGLLCSFNSFTYLGSDYALAYNLADAGYDVWLGNARGNKYSRRHVSLDPDTDSRKFFDFSYEEVGLYDLPAMIDFVLAKTKRDKLYYVGHAQGGTAFFVLNSLNTTYQSKFASVHLMAGIGYEKYFPNKIVKLLSTAIDPIYSVALLIDYVELKPSSKLTTILAETLVNSTVPQELIGGGSLRQAAHYSQNYRDESFRRWNYVATNLLKYGRLSPPSYDLSKINVDVTMHYALGDAIQGENDVLDMVKAMPNARVRKVARSDFGHIDFLASKDVKKLVFDYIIESFNNA